MLRSPPRSQPLPLQPHVLTQLPPQQQQQQQPHPHHPLFRRPGRDDSKKESKKNIKDVGSKVQPQRQQLPRQPQHAGKSNSPTGSSGSSRRIHFLDALALVHVSPNLLQSPGMPVLRVEANGRTIASFLRLTHDKFTVTLISEEKASLAANMLAYMACKSSPMDVRDIDIGEMDRIQRGQATQQFEKAKQKTANKNHSNNNNNSSGESSSSRRLDLLRSASYSSRNSNNGNGSSSNVMSNLKKEESSALSTSGGTTTSTTSNANTRRSSSNSPTVAGEQQQQQQNQSLLDPNRSFSIIFRGAHTLDMMAMSKQERNEICDSLDRILSAYQRAKVRVADDVRLLRHVWIDVIQKHNDKHHHSHRRNNSLGGSTSSLVGGDYAGGESNKVLQLNERQVAKVFLQINFSMKTRDLQNAYDKFGKVIGLDRSARRKGLTFEQLADFLHYVRRNQWMVKPVTVLWNGLFGEIMKNGKQRETVSDKTFAEKFLYATQHQHTWTMTDVRKLFRLLHDMEISHRKSTLTTGGGGGGAAAAIAASGGGGGGGDYGGMCTDLNRINKDQFEAFLFSTHHNEAFDPEKERHRISDMDRPLSEYFINSSHNTYLVGDQYTSQSSVEMYSNALYRGCRCLELDIWDGPAVTDNKTGKQQLVPVVWHGHTMTTKIFFSDIIQCVKVFLNFHPTEYPIILSFENHCSIPYQRVLAEELIRILGDSLYIPTEASLNGKLPSPLQLRGRVVIKGRRPNKKSSSIINDGTIGGSNANNGGHAEVECSYEEHDQEDDDSEDGCECGGEHTRNSSTSTTGHTNDTTCPVIKEVPPAPSFATKPIVEDEEAMQYDVAPELARITLFHGQKYKNWDESMAIPTYCMHSFSENQLRAKVQAKVRAPPSRSSKLASSTSLSVSTSSTSTTSHRLFSIYNQTHMTRIYPAGSRVDSSNYNPLLAWSAGCQMVALNYQTQDSFLRLNDGRFRENGNCGYVLKPSPLMIHKPWDDESQQGVRENEPVKMTIRVLCGSCLPKAKGLRTGECISPYARVSVFDVSNGADGEIKETVTEYVTGVVKNNGFNPIWTRDTKYTFMVNDWAVAMLQLTVYDESGKAPDDFIASASMPISCLRRGIRSVKLYDANNTRSAAFDFCSLLLEIKIGQAVAEI